MKYKINSFQKELFKALITLSIPTIIEQILSILLQYIDTAMVGRLGEQATAAVSVTTTITWLIGSTFSAFGVGILALISRALGSNDHLMIQKISRQAFLISIVSGIIIEFICIFLSPYIPVWMGAEPAVQADANMYFFIISLPLIFRSINYIMGAAIRGTKDTKTPMFISIGSNIVNAVLNAILIYGFNMGVVGAAIASAISYTFGGIFMFIAYKQNTLLNWNFKTLKPDFNILKACANISIPVLGTSLVSSFGYIVFAGMVSSMGTTTFAAHSIAVTAETIFYTSGYGLRTATSTLIGISLGERNQKKFETICSLSIIVTIVIMLTSGILLYFIATPLMSVFTNSEQIVLIGAKMLKLVAFSEPFFGLMVVSQGIYYGLGKTHYSFVIEAFGMWGVRILFTFLCVNIWKLDLTAVWYCMIADNTCKAILLSIPLHSNKKRQKLIKHIL